MELWRVKDYPPGWDPTTTAMEERQMIMSLIIAMSMMMKQLVAVC